MGGDFNVVRFPCERRKGGIISSSIRHFSEVMEELELSDIPLQGGPFTWRGGNNNCSMSRIDPFLVSNDWESHFSNVIQFTLPMPTSLSNHAGLGGGGGGGGGVGVGVLLYQDGSYTFSF